MSIKSVRRALSESISTPGAAILICGPQLENGPGTCTYPKADRVGAVAAGIPLRWMAVETDAPYLPPQPHRGGRNEPAYLRDTVARIAELRGDSVQTVAERTAMATAWLFGLGDITGAELRPQSEEVK